jgi:hypothetical protein
MRGAGVLSQAPNKLSDSHIQGMTRRRMGGSIGTLEV